MNVSPAWSGDQPQKAIYSATKRITIFSTTQEWIKIQNWHASLISWETVNSKIQHKPILGLFSQFSLSYLAVGALYYYIIPLIRQVYSRHFFLLVNTCTICILYIDIYIYIDIHTYIHAYIHTYQCVLFLIEVDNYLSRQIRSRTPVGTGTLLSHLSSLCSTNHSRGGEWHSQRVSSVCVCV